MRSITLFIAHIGHFYPTVELHLLLAAVVFLGEDLSVGRSATFKFVVVKLIPHTEPWLRFLFRFRGILSLCRCAATTTASFYGKGDQEDPFFIDRTFMTGYY